MKLTMNEWDTILRALQHMFMYWNERVEKATVQERDFVIKSANFYKDLIEKIESKEIGQQNSVWPFRTKTVKTINKMFMLYSYFRNIYKLYYKQSKASA